jgi:ankyrin repeat protein
LGASVISCTSTSSGLSQKGQRKGKQSTSAQSELSIPTETLKAEIEVFLNSGFLIIDFKKIQELIDDGASVNVEVNDELSALMIAVFSSNATLVQLLLNAGADPNLTYSHSNVTALMLASNYEKTTIQNHLYLCFQCLRRNR